MKRTLLFILGAFLTIQLSFAQSISSKVAVDSTSVFSVGCIGTPLLIEEFSSGIPSDWMVWDYDSLTPVSALGMDPGWQSITDYRDSDDQAVASPSWYLPDGSSEDWIVSPAIVLNGAICFSWEAYSQDPLFPEMYEVRLGSATGDTASFFAQAPIFTDSATSGTPGVYSVVLEGYTNDTVRIAFRQFSSNEYVLVLDDIHITSILERDAKVLTVDSLAIEANDSVEITGTIANAGSETLESVRIEYAVNGGVNQTMLIDSLGLPAFKACTFTHAVLWSVDSLGTFDFCAWTRLPNGLSDQNASNDTICQEMAVTSFLALENDLQDESFHLFPNPASSFIHIHSDFEGTRLESLKVLDLSGSVVMEHAALELPHTLEIGHLPQGLYFVELNASNQNPIYRRMLVQ